MWIYLTLLNCTLNMFLKCQQPKIVQMHKKSLLQLTTEKKNTWKQ